MRRSSARLRDLAIAMAVVASLVLVPAGPDAQANSTCTVQEWGTWSGAAAGMNVSWDSYNWSIWIAPTGTVRAANAAGQYENIGTRIGGGVGSASFTWDTTRFANGLYDVIGQHREARSSGFFYAICAMRILNVPTAPSPVLISPRTNTVDVFDASWGAASVPGGLAYYEYYADCDPSRILTTASQGARLIGQAVTRGTHALCVRAVDRSGARGPHAYGYFTYVLIPTTLTLSVPASITAGTPVPMSAVLLDANGRPMAGRTVYLNDGGYQTTGRTDSAGRFSATLPGLPVGAWTASATFVSDGTYATSRIARTIVVTKITATLSPLAAPQTVMAGAPVTASTVLSDASGRPLPGRSVRLYTGWGASQWVTTDASGRATATLSGTTRIGTYPIGASFAGDASFSTAAFARSINVVGDTRPPSIPTNVVVSPASSATNRFTATFPLPTDDLSGLDVIEFRIDGGTVFHTGSFAGYAGPTVSLPIQAPSYGIHRIEVRSSDRAGNRSDWSVPASFEWRRATTSIAITGLPASVPRCSAIDVSARLTSEGTPLPGRAVSLRIGGAGATAMTNAQGIASASIPFEGSPGQYAVTATFAGDTTLPGAQSTANVQVTGDPARSCQPTGGGGPPGGGEPPGGGGPPGGGQGPGTPGQGGLSVDIPPR